MMKNLTASRVLGGVTGLVLTMSLLLGCTGDKTPVPTTSSNETTPSGPSKSAAGNDATAVTKKVFATPEDRKPIGSATGTIVRQDGQQIAEVLSVETGATGTYLSWRLKSPDGKEQSLTWLWGVAPLTENEPLGDLRAIRLVSPDGTFYKATTFDRKQRAPESSSYCLCSPMPKAIPAGGGVELYGYYPPLPADVKTVTVQIAGLPDIANVPVTKAE